MNLLLARHGESEWIVRGDEAGFNSPLTDGGRRQARLLGRWLAANPLGSSPSGRSQGIDAIYASPLIRARETAEIVAVELDLPFTLDDDLREFEVSYWRDNDDYAPPYINGSAVPPAYLAESYLPFKARVQEVARRILEAHPEGTVLIVAHGGTVGTIVRCLLGVHNFGVQTDPTGLHGLHWTGSRWIIEFMNRLDHLLEKIE
ncbi:MAG: histidine phosphatase family protein [Anaerolineae bacterium]